MLYEDYIKAAKVIISCNTLEQLDVASKYIELVYKRINSTLQAILLIQLLDKKKQLEDDTASGCCPSFEH